MRVFQTIVAWLIYINCSAQSRNNTNVIGSIYVPSLQSINVDFLQSAAIQFTKAEEFDHGKLLPSFIRASVVSNVPYLVSVMANSDFFNTTSTHSNPMPVSIISLRDNISNQFVNLSAIAKPLLINKTGNMKTEYTIDASIKPGWNYAGGQYSTTLIFTLTPQ